MPAIDLKKADIPFLADGSGMLRLQADVADPTKPLPPTDKDIFNLDFSAGGSQSFSIGAANSLKLGINVGTSARLIPLWATSSPERLKILDEYGLNNYFDGGAANRLLLLLALGTEADASLSAKFNYLNLSASASLSAGADAGYALIRSYPVETPLVDLVKDLFKGLRLPANVDGPLADDEVIAFEYGGYLKFGAKLAAGYEISGAPSFQIGELNLTEKYAFSVMAGLSLAAGVAGQFKIEVRQGAKAGWARVVARKSRSRSFSIAADVTAKATFEEKGLPESADEFLGALLGLNAKNWLNMFKQIRELSDFNKLEAYLDNLAKSFIEEYSGKAFDALADKTQLDETIDLIGKAIDEYNQVGDRAVTLFDKYYNAAKTAVEAELTDALKFIKEAVSLEQFKGKVNDTVWKAIEHLTDGDPLGWLLGKIEIDGRSVDSLEELKARAGKTLDLLQSSAHEEIRRVIKLAKSKFPLNKFIEDLEHIDWTTLKSMTNRRLKGFVERIIGQELKKLGASELGKSVNRFREVLDNIENFKNTSYEKIREILDQSFKFHLHAEYSKATEDAALLDLEIDLNNEAGRSLMNRAGHGDFGDVIAAFDGGAVKINEGLFTHKVTRQSKFSVNVIGWHLGWNYQGLDRLIIDSKQRIKPDGNGQLTIITTMEMEKERERKRNGERVYTNLLLRFIGESRGAVEFDKANQIFLIDAIKRMSAKYELVFQDPDTTPQELAQYLSFADDFGITLREEDALAEIQPLLPTDSRGNYGETSISYTARFTEEGLRALFTKPFSQADEVMLRRTMRLIVLANYLNKGTSFTDRGWAYWTPSVRAVWVNEQINFANRSSLMVDPVEPSPIKNLKAPTRVALSKLENQFIQLDRLYTVENLMIEGMRKLSEIIQSKKKMSARDFEKALTAFGSALKKYDDIDEGENTVFALFDKLIGRETMGKQLRNSSLEIKSKLDGKEIVKMLIA